MQPSTVPATRIAVSAAVMRAACSSIAAIWQHAAEHPMSGEARMASALKVAVQMDPIEAINIDADSTFALMLEARRRGHSLWHYEVRNLALREGVRRQGERREERLMARARP